MKIGVISDTHIAAAPRFGVRAGIARLVNGDSEKLLTELDKNIRRHFSGVDMIVHAGDIISEPVLSLLSDIAPLKAVRGNIDPIEIDLPEKEIFLAGEKTIALTHGSGGPRGIIERLHRRLVADEPDLVIYGHTHRPGEKLFNGVLFFNPGSPTDRIFAPYRSLGLVEIGVSIKTEIIRIDS